MLCGGRFVNRPYYFTVTKSGVVKVSTGILKHEERAALDCALKSPILNINANNNLAYAA